MADVADLRVKYSADTSDFDRGADKVDKGIKGFISQAGAFAAGDLLAGGIRAIGGAAIGAGGAMVGMAMDAADLNAQISGIAALAGGGAEEMALLKAEISELGMDPNLVVSATEAADVMQNLVANGLSVTDVLNGAAEATVLLGNAAGADLATSATVMSDTMTIFGIEAENAMTAVDGISRVTNQSKFDVEDYALALAQGGAQAASAGVEFDDFNAMLVASASNFSSGSDAGTGLRNMLTKLIPTTADARSTMYDLGLVGTDWEAAASRLSNTLGRDVAPNQFAVIDAFKDMSRAQGVNVNDIKQLDKAWGGFADDFEDSAFFDAQGELEDAATIAGALNTAFEGMSEHDVSEALNTMFGPDAARAVLAMAEYTEEGFRAMQDEMNGTASAMENASIRTDNLKGDMDVFGGTLEAVSLKIGDTFQPALRTLYQSGTQLLTELEPAIVGGAQALADGVTAIMPSVVAAIEGIVGAAAAVAQDGFSALFTVFEDGSSYVGGFAVALGASEEKVLAVGRAFYSLKGAFAEGGWSEVFTVFEDGSSYIGGLAIALGASEAKVTAVGQAFYDLKGAVAEGGISEIFTVFEDGSSYIGGFATALGASEASVIAIGKAFYGLKGAVKEGGLSEIFTVFEDGSSYIGGLAIALGANEAAVTSFGQSIYNLKGAFKEGGFKGLFDEAFANVDIGASLAALRTHMIASFATFDLSSVAAKVGSSLSAAFAGLNLSGTGINLEGLRTSLTNAFANFDFSGTINTAKGQVNGLRDGMLASITDTINNINWSGASISFAGMVDAVSAKVSAIDWSSVTLGDVGMKLVSILSPGLGLAIKTAQWVMSSDSWSGLVTSVKTSLTQIQWGDIGASFGTLATAISTGISQIDTSGLTTLFEGTELEGITTTIDTIGAAFGRVSTQLGSAGTIMDEYFVKLKAHLAGLNPTEGEGPLAGLEPPDTEKTDSYFTKLSVHLAALDEQGKGVGKSFNEAMTFDLGAFDEWFNKLTGADTIIKSIGASLVGMKKSAVEALTWDFSALDTAWNEYWGRVTTGFENLKTELGFGETTPAWLTALQGWEWPALTDLLAWKWPEYLAWTWEPYTPWTWTAYNPWTWTAYNAWTWTAYPSWTWPPIAMPGWVTSLLNWDPSSIISGATSRATDEINKALNVTSGGSNSPAESVVDKIYSLAPGWSDGPTTSGPTYTPGNGGRGMMLPNLVGATPSGGITININGYNADPETLARQILAIIDRRRG